MKKVIQALKVGILFVLLTVVTQVGGLIYLIYKPLGYWINKKVKRRSVSLMLRGASFAGMMLIASLLIIPPLAKLGGRVPLPVFQTESLKPANLLLVLANRHYVKPQLKTLSIQLSEQLAQSDPGRQLIYLDAGFPFWNGFPLLPHLSHDDGEKLDLCFLYKDRQTGEELNQAPSWLGYGYCEQPKPGEHDQIAICRRQGNWQYSLLSRLTRQNKRFVFDSEANAWLLRQMARDGQTGKIFLEPHLKSRMGLSGFGKIRYHGCQAVRHDDHIHLQL